MCPAACMEKTAHLKTSLEAQQQKISGHSMTDASGWDTNMWGVIRGSETAGFNDRTDGNYSAADKKNLLSVRA